MPRPFAKFMSTGLEIRTSILTEILRFTTYLWDEKSCEAIRKS